MKNLKKFLFVTLLMVLSISCGSNTSNNKTKIRFATWDNAETLTFQQEIVDEFNKKQDKIEVSIEAYGDNYDTKITASMGSGDAPDVMYMWNYPKYSKGLLQLDELIEKEGSEYISDFYEALWNYNSFEGKKYGIPVGYTTRVLYYNKDLFDKAGISYPNENWTWSDVYDASRKLTDKSKKIYGIAFPVKPDPYDYEMFSWSNGSSFVNKNGEYKNIINNSKNVEVYETIQNLIKENIAISTEDYGEKNFILGKVAMFMNGSWSIKRLNEKGINYGVELLPMFKADIKSKSIISSSGVAISKGSKNVDAAWEFVKFYTGKEMNKKRVSYEFPVLKSVVSELKIEEDPINMKFYKMLENSQDNMPASFVSNKWDELSEKLSLALEQILNKNALVQPKKALDDISK